MREILSSTDTQLHSGHVFWPARNKSQPRYPALEGDVKCDVVVIGGGITGALVSFRLVSAGFSTALVDKHSFGTGSTCASTALISYEFDELLSKLVRQLGEERAIRSYELCYDAVSSLKRLVEDIEDPCDYDDKYCVRISTNPGHTKTFETECELRNKHGFKVEVLQEPELIKRFDVSAPLGLACANAAQIDPFRLTASLIKAGVRKGMKAYEDTRITTFDAGAKEVLLRSAGGATVTAANVVFATGYETEKYLKRKLASMTTDFCFVTPSNKSPGKLDKCHIVEHADDYFYASTFGDRVIVGVQDRRFYRPGQRAGALRTKTDELKERVQQHFPGVKLTTDLRWAGTFAKSQDSLPYIGTTPRFPRGIFVLGYGGNGIASSAMLSTIIVDMLKGKQTSDAKLFAFDR